MNQKRKVFDADPGGSQSSIHPFFHLFRMPGKIYNNELYVLGVERNSQVYNFETKQWRPMSDDPMPINPGLSPCMVIWRDSFITFGGAKVVLLFNTTSKVRYFQMLHVNWKSVQFKNY